MENDFGKLAELKKRLEESRADTLKEARTVFKQDLFQQKIEKAIEDINCRIKEMNESIEKLDNRTDSFEEDIGDIENRLSDLESDYYNSDDDDEEN